MQLQRNQVEERVAVYKELYYRNLKLAVNKTELVKQADSRSGI